MKKIYLIIALCIISVSVQAGRDKNSQAGDLYGNTIIGKEISWMALDAYYKGEITRIDLANYKGKWIVLFFYPADFTFVCPTELKELADFYKEFRDNGAEIFSISTDSAYVHMAWQKENPLLKEVKYPMLSDRNGNFSRSLGVYNEKTGTAIRASFIVDPDGRIVAAEFTHDSMGRSSGELLRKLDAAIAIRKGGGLCPAGWTEGSEMIKEK